MSLRTCAQKYAALAAPPTATSASRRRRRTGRHEAGDDADGGRRRRRRLEESTSADAREKYGGRGDGGAECGGEGVHWEQRQQRGVE